MTSRLVYELLNIMPMLIILPGFILFSIIVSCSLCPCWVEEKFSTTIIIILTKFAKGIFGDKTGVFSDTNFQVEKDKRGIPLTYIRGKKVSHNLMVFVGLLAFSLYLYTVMAFWDAFLLKESFFCDTQADCFVDGGGSDPVDNCAEILTEGDNITVTCYKYVFDIGTAIGVSGGIITALGLTMSTAAGFWLFWYDLIKGKRCAIIICVLLQYIIALSFVVIICYILVTYVIPPKKHPKSLQLQYHVVFQIICLSMTLFMGLAFPWCLFSQDSNSKDSDFKDSDSQNSNSERFRLERF